MSRPMPSSYRWQPEDRARIDRLRRRLSGRTGTPTDIDVLRAGLASLEADLDREAGPEKKSKKSAS